MSRNKKPFPKDFMFRLSDSDRAIEVNIAIMRTFTRLREMLSTHRELDLELDHNALNRFEDCLDLMRI